MKTSVLVTEGFKGEKAIRLPMIFKDTQHVGLFDKKLYITHIGYYPNAANHYRKRPSGCQENILIYCSDGKGWIFHGGNRINMGEDTFYIIPAREAHSYGSGDNNPWSIYWLHFKGENDTLLNQLKGKRIALQTNNYLQNKNILDLFNNIYDNLSACHQVDTLEYVSCALEYFLACLKYQDKFQKEADLEELNLIKKCKDYMLENLANKISLTDIALHVGYSASHLTRFFTERMHMSPITYYNKLRIKQAKNYLQFSNYRIKEISFMLGFYDQYHFSKSFHKEVGMTPKDYRNQYACTVPE